MDNSTLLNRKAILHGSLKNAQNYKDLYGNPLERDWRTMRLRSIQIFLICKVHKNFSLREIKLKLYMSAYLWTMFHYFLITFHLSPMTKCSVFLTNCCKRPIGCKYSSDKNDMHSLYILKDRQLQNCPRNQYFIIQIKYYDRTLYFTIPFLVFEYIWFLFSLHYNPYFLFHLKVTTAVTFLPHHIKRSIKWEAL